MKFIDQDDLDGLSRAAACAPRQRMNLNLHQDYSDPCQRLFNALEPGTYIRPHRHTEPPKTECFLAVRGRMALLLFDDGGAVVKTVIFGAGCEILAVDLPPGLWHSVICLEPGSVFFETKPGPYVALSDKDFAPWAPLEGSADAADYLKALQLAVVPVTRPVDHA